MLTLKLSQPSPTGEVTVTITDGPDHDVQSVEEYTVQESEVDSDLAEQGFEIGTRIGERHWILFEIV